MSSPATIPDPRACQSKRRYGSEDQAIGAARRRWFDAMVALRAYTCDFCGGWHLTKTRAAPPVDARFGPPAPTKDERRRAALRGKRKRRR